MVQAEVPDPVALVLAVLPLQVELVVPELIVFPLLVVTLVKSVLIAASTLINVPAVGAVLAVNEVPVRVPEVLRLLTKLAHCVAVTVLPADVVATADWPHPLSPLPVLQKSLRLAPAVVLTNPL
jgi:hypothetical protein